MPIRLEPPTHRHGGPDGQGWNRISLNAHMGTPTAQCALKPTTAATLVESWDTRRARWGNFGPCTRDGSCATCPMLDSDPTRIPAHTERILVRLKPSDAAGVNLPPDTPYIVDDPDAGWVSPRYRWTWSKLSRLIGWRFDGMHRDEHGDGFWLHKDDPSRLYGCAEAEAL